MLNNPEVYPDPFKFDPERHIATPEKPAQRDPRHACFGFARRICVGMQLAEASLWICIAMSLAVFDITPALDEAGKPIIPEHELTGGTIRYICIAPIPGSLLTSFVVIPKRSSVLFSQGPRRLLLLSQLNFPGKESSGF